MLNFGVEMLPLGVINKVEDFQGLTVILLVIARLFTLTNSWLIISSHTQHEAWITYHISLIYCKNKSGLKLPPWGARIY